MRVAKVPRTCEACGATFEVYPSQIRRAEERGQQGPRFCSTTCFETTRPGPLCTKCRKPNTRGARTRLCAACVPLSPAAQKRQRADERQAACPEGRRWCTACDEFLPPAHFNSDDNLCIPCQTQRNNVSHLRRNYGIDPETYEKLLRHQEGRCAICRGVPKKQRLHVDHDHKTGEIRGLLCLWCNHKLMGGARESLDILKAAVQYMETPPAVSAIGSVVVAKKVRRAS